mmetsp:Transcript_29397/g.40981  ORF Transcript_29397/g.40981 Transcript_29397/m.40981 type:complete len:231 (-) Transcript_29397:539-1231(-)
MYGNFNDHVFVSNLLFLIKVLSIVTAGRLIRCAPCSRSTSITTTVQLRHDWVNDCLQLFMLVFELINLCILILLYPLYSLVNSFLCTFFVSRGDLALEFLVIQRIAHIVAVALQLIFCLHPGSSRIVLSLHLLSFLDHVFNLLRAQASAIICNSDTLRLFRLLVLCGNIQNAVSIYVKRDLDLRNTPWSWRNAFEIELAKEMIIPCHPSLPFVYLDRHCRLVVLERREDL